MLKASSFPQFPHVPLSRLHSYRLIKLKQISQPKAGDLHKDSHINANPGAKYAGRKMQYKGCASIPSPSLVGKKR